MKNQKRIIFAPHRLIKKQKCPSCNDNSFVVFYNTETKELIMDAGRCDHGSSCGYFKHWKDSDKATPAPKLPETTGKVKIHFSRYLNYERPYSGSKLFMFYYNMFPKHTDIIHWVWRRYRMGASYYGHTAYPFWYNFFELSCAKMIKYDEKGKRIHNTDTDKSNDYVWTDQQTKQGKEIEWIPFGWHLVNDDKNKEFPIIIHEGVKNPLVAEIIDRIHNKPQRIHIATGSLYLYDSINLFKKTLSERDVSVISDKGCIEYWKGKIDLKNASFLDFLENCEGVPDGGDYEDFLKFKRFIK